MCKKIETAIKLIIFRTNGFNISSDLLLPILKQSGFDDNFIKTFEKWIHKCGVVQNEIVCAGDIISNLFRTAFYVITKDKSMALLFHNSRLNLRRYISEKCSGGLSVNTAINQDETMAFSEICRLNRIYSDPERISVNKYHSIFIKAAKSTLKLFPNMNVDDFMIKYQLEIIRMISS